MSRSLAVIHLQQVSRIFGLGEAAVVACDRVNLTIQPGEYCAIMGQSGSGKSTLTNLIGCLDRPSQGQYQLDGVNVAKIKKNHWPAIAIAKLPLLAHGRTFPQDGEEHDPSARCRSTAGGLRAPLG